ncbi:cysteine protease ATG4B-like isoform X3 [Centruroides vittatus]|uniref:cysteine protease ATG4B-like isoform X3 n=1 Tax=Centruroides vittatus TaxID=120091 RepID=UPI0035102B97
MKACMAYEPSYKEYSDFPYTEEPVWILGKKYSILHDLEELRVDICSKIWFTYRKNFSPIGGTGPTSDSGWGCMLRCGQMVMAQALVFRHLGKGWIWNPRQPDPIYLDILKMFQDKKDCPYSIHQIAQMGVSEGKGIGQWFGPNTIAQVLRKLATYDEWSHLVVHVALDNAVITDDLSKSDIMILTTFYDIHFKIDFILNVETLCKVNQESECKKYEANESTSVKISNSCSLDVNRSSDPNWKPLLLFIPLRLGLSEINPVYLKALKITFCLKQSLGIIGGKPNHALYFIGVVGNEVVYLDPHTTQQAIDTSLEIPNDSSYHCPYGNSRRMNLNQMDPSVALCFYFQTEEEFDSWCVQVHKVGWKKQFLIAAETQPLFELSKERPLHWPPLQVADDKQADSSLEFTFVEERAFEASDDEFEIL